LCLLAATSAASKGNAADAASKEEASAPHELIGVRHSRLIQALVNPEFSRAQAASAVRERRLISGVRTSQNHHLMIAAERHTVNVFGADAA